MEFEPEDQPIVDLLTKLRNKDRAYPRKLLVSRRQTFLSQMTSVGLGLGLGAGIKTVAKASKSGGLFYLSSASSLLEVALLLAIVTQAGIIVYSYRDRIADFVNSMSSPTAPTSVSVPVTGPSETDIVVSDTPLATITITETAIPTATFEPNTPLSSDPKNGNDNSEQSTAVAETPHPTNDDNGNHYGQTPRPGRPTQEKNEPKPTKKGGGGNGNN